MNTCIEDPFLRFVDNKSSNEETPTKSIDRHARGHHLEIGFENNLDNVWKLFPAHQQQQCGHFTHNLYEIFRQNAAILSADIIEGMQFVFFSYLQQKIFIYLNSHSKNGKTRRPFKRSRSNFVLRGRKIICLFDEFVTTQGSS